MKPKFNRQDIIDAHYLAEAHYNVGGVLWERPSNKRRQMSSGFQIHRMSAAHPEHCLGARTLVSARTWRNWKLSPNAKAVYRDIERRLKLK